MLRRFYPDIQGAYFEPFVGSGAVFFDLLERGSLEGRTITLSDENADLIGCYLRVADALDRLLVALDELAHGHAAGGRAFYMQVRDQRFNPLRAEWRDRGSDVATYPAELAAMLIYLNRTGYNGLFRLNASGAFNVPPGRYDRPRIVDRPLLTSASRALTAPNVRLKRAAFDHVLESARRDDFVYFDPPYAPVSPTANFRAYTDRGFGDADQERLQAALITLAERGVHVLLSNSTAPTVTRLYNSAAAKRAGLRSWRVPARRAVNSRADGRGAVTELVVSNIRQLGKTED